MNKEHIFRNIHIFLVIALLSVVVFNGALGVVFATVVLDTTPPVLNLPSDMWVSAPGPSGATVSFSATATDTDPTNPTVTCTPASGSVFPLGSTTVSCSATDTAGNTATGSFVVSVGGAKITSERVTLNGTSTVTVKGGDTVTATMVNTSVMSGEWMSTSYQIGGGSVVCVDTPNHGVGTNYTESFPIVAPLAEGVYTVMFGFFSEENCSGDPAIRSGLPNGLVVDTTPSPAFSILGGSGGGSTGSAVYRIGDINKDRQVNLLDLVLMMANWGKTGYNECDLNRDGIVDKYDFALLMLNWGL